MTRRVWFDRQFTFGLGADMLPYYLERLTGTAARLKEKLRNVPDEKLSHQPNGKWSIKQHIGHLAEVDEIANKRIDEMQASVTPMSPAVFEPKGDYNAMPIDDVINLFIDNRRRNLDKYRSLRQADLGKASLHPRLKVLMTPVDLALFDAEHDDHHLVTINEILSRAV